MRLLIKLSAKMALSRQRRGKTWAGRRWTGRGLAARFKSIPFQMGLPLI